MLVLKSPEEIELIRESNQLVSKTLAEVAALLKPGVTTLQLDARAEEFIRDEGGLPGFKGYNGFPNTLCTSVNEEVVHGIPSNYALKEGDIVSVDCGVKKNGFYGDTAFTFVVGEVDPHTRTLLKITRESLELGVQQAKTGNRLGDIGSAVQKHAEEHGFSVVRELVGHGLGKDLHESPEVPNYGKRGTGMKLKEGMVLCIEPMINMGGRHIRQETDGWTIRTMDMKPSAHYEYAVAITARGADVLSTFSFIEEVLTNKLKN